MSRSGISYYESNEMPLLVHVGLAIAAEAIAMTTAWLLITALVLAATSCIDGTSGSIGLATPAWVVGESDHYPKKQQKGPDDQLSVLSSVRKV